MSFPTLQSTGTDALNDILREPISRGSIPATFIGATNARETIHFGFAGDKVYGKAEAGQVDEDTIVQLFSATKAVTTVACVILSDRGILSLDDPALIKQHLPELTDLDIFKGYDEDGNPMHVKRRNREITLRMLLSHTSGMSYAIYSDLTRQWVNERGNPRILGGGGKRATMQSLDFPLVYEPGTGWSYSPGLDWAGVLVERVTGRDLESFFRENIFVPLKMTSTTFFPTEEVKSRLMSMTKGLPDRSIECFPDNFESHNMPREGDPSKVGPLLAGGAGLYSTARDFLALLRAILASGIQGEVRPEHAIISKAGHDEMFRDVCASEKTPDDPYSGKQRLLEIMDSTGYHDKALLGDKSGSHVGHAIGLCLNLADSSNGRKAGSGCWDGVAKTPFWIDPTTGVAGLCFTNIFQGLPSPFVDTFVKFERTLYDHLQ